MRNTDIELAECPIFCKLHMVFLFSFLLDKTIRLTSDPLANSSVWQASTLSARFIEVKGPGDQLSSTQKIWIDVMLGANIVVEVCRVVEKARTSWNREADDTDKKLIKKPRKSDGLDDGDQAEVASKKVKIKVEDDGLICIDDSD